MSGQTMMIVGIAVTFISIVAEIVLSVVFRKTNKKMIKRIYDEAE